jgi:hypothetical protein
MISCFEQSRVPEIQVGWTLRADSVELAVRMLVSLLVLG